MTTRCVILASGPSLTVADAVLAFNSGRRVYLVSDTYYRLPAAPMADVLYSCDKQWWDLHEQKTRLVAYERWTTDLQASQVYGLAHIPGSFHGDFDVSGQGIVYGSNSGFQTLNLAFAQGMRDVVLLGFDMGGKGHFFGDHPAPLHNAMPFRTWIERFNKAAPIIKRAGMRVVNATRSTALECFDRAAPEDALT